MRPVPRGCLDVPGLCSQVCASRTATEDVEVWMGTVNFEDEPPAGWPGADALAQWITCQSCDVYVVGAQALSFDPDAQVRAWVWQALFGCGYRACFAANVTQS